MLKKTGVFLVFIYILSSCVPHKKIVYFQGEPVNERSLREYNNKPYRLQVDDILNIDIKGQNEELVAVFSKAGKQASGQASLGMAYMSGYSVDKQGFIEIPYLDKINVLGYTTKEVSKKIKEGLAKYFKSIADIFVSVKLAGVKYTIIGEVGSTGTKTLYQNTVNIVEAIANSGDITMTGDRTKVEIIRLGIDGVEKYRVDLTQISIFNSKEFYIQPNDIINVPPVPQKSLGTGTTGMQTFSTVVSVLSFLTTSYLLIKSL